MSSTMTSGKRIYRLSLDDNIWFLQDLARRDSPRQSIFDNPYLGFFFNVHQQFGTKVHINIYYECPEHGGFNLTEMPDRYRDEWAAAADWLHLSFHARADKPNAPYIHAGYEQVRTDCELVHAEIRRFAGPASLPRETTLHFAEATADGVRALRDCGYDMLLGDFILGSNGEPRISYHLDRERWEQVRQHGILTDRETGVLFVPCDIVLNSFAPAEIPVELDRVAARWPGRGFCDILIHEQYFYPDYVRYLSDYRERVIAGVRWCIAHGFEPGFISDFVG